MIGTNRIVLNNETICKMVEEYMNARTVKAAVKVTRVKKMNVALGYADGKEEWVATIEPAPEPDAKPLPVTFDNVTFTPQPNPNEITRVETALPVGAIPVTS